MAPQFHNTSKVVRVADRTKNFSIIPNDIAQSISLTPTEKSLLIHLLSMPDNWYYVKTQFWKRTNMGRDACYKAWDSLTEKGYIKQTKIIQNNLIVGYHYEISDIPKLGHTDIQTNRKSVNNKRTKQTKKELKKKDIQKSVEANSIEADKLGVGTSMDKPTRFQIENGLV
jgi:hypothetical protein